MWVVRFFVVLMAVFTVGGVLLFLGWLVASRGLGLHALAAALTVIVAIVVTSAWWVFENSEDD